MNLWLSPQGIWYVRKVTTLPCGRRKEIKKSLRTRDKLAARNKVSQLLSCVRSRAVPTDELAATHQTPSNQPSSKPAAQAAKPLVPLLSVLSDRYLNLS